MKAVILAGGVGTRLSEETLVRPKPMVEIGEYPILWHVMKIFDAHGIHDFIVCCGNKGMLIKEYFAGYRLRHSDVTFDLARNEVLPPCKTKILSAMRTVEKRCEISMAIFPRVSSANRWNTSCSDFASNDAVGSSSTRTCASRRYARASASFCHSPPERSAPPSKRVPSCWS